MKTFKQFIEESYGPIVFATGNKPRALKKGDKLYVELGRRDRGWHSQLKGFTKPSGKSATNTMTQETIHELIVTKSLSKDEVITVLDAQRRGFQPLYDEPPKFYKDKF